MKCKLFGLSLIVLGAASIAASALVPQSQGHREQVIKFMDEVWNKGNFAYIDQAMDPEIARFGHVSEGNTYGIAAYKDQVAKIRSSFTDYNITLKDMMGVGNKATYTWQLRGNYVGPDKKLSPGRTVDIMGKTVWIFKGDKVIREVVEMDQDEYYRQIQMAQPYSEVGNRALMLSYLYEVVSHGEVSSLEELVAQNHVLHNLGGDKVTGQAALREHVLALRAAFPDMTIKIGDVISEGNHVSARWTLEGTHKAEWNGIPASDRKVVASGITFMTIKDDKIQETWNFLDLMVSAKVAR
jgi:steroid delta-isomerase-like uncharacterized protein